MAGPIVGEIRMLANGEAPPGWASCDGQVLQIREYKQLFAVLGSTYGGNGTTTFALPDLRGRTPIHSSPGKIDRGQAGGETNHTITPAEIPAHAHGSMGMIGTFTTFSGVQVAAGPAPATARTGAATTTLSLPATNIQEAQAAGHDNLQPYLAVKFIIALEGASPGRK